MKSIEELSKEIWLTPEEAMLFYKIHSRNTFKKYIRNGILFFSDKMKRVNREITDNMMTGGYSSKLKLEKLMDL
ncbi:MAG: hypothetical protein ACD_79C01515G0006 [uncultured bacterium]|nr:MAG: hypothetical protein ACD_79C01515G0006 [uncultured bacterium]